jgi:hypothetical protein
MSALVPRMPTAEIFQQAEVLTVMRFHVFLLFIRSTELRLQQLRDMRWRSGCNLHDKIKYPEPQEQAVSMPDGAGPQQRADRLH